MAWQARVTRVQRTAATLALDVDYFDDAAPTTVLHRQSFVYGGDGFTMEQITGDLRESGRRARAALQAAQAAATQITVGQTIAV